MKTGAGVSSRPCGDHSGLFPLHFWTPSPRSQAEHPARVLFLGLPALGTRDALLETSIVSGR